MHEEHTSFNIVGKTAHFFASNKPLSLLVLISVLAFGLFSFALTPKQYNPEIVRPAFAIQLSYGGASSKEAIDRVVYELVEKISAVPGVDEIISEVHDGAQIGTTVIFDVGYDTTKAKVDLLSQLEQHSSLAQGFISKPHVIEINPETIPVLQIVFSSASLSIDEVRARTVEISRALTSIPEVSDASVTGGYVPSVRIDVDPLRLASAGVTISEVRQTLSQGEKHIVLGGYTTESNTIGIVFDSQITSPEDIGAFLITPSLRIRDVATVYSGAPSTRAYTVYDTKKGEPAEVVMLAVSKVEGSSAPAVTEAVQKKIADLLTKDSYADMSYHVVSDDGQTASGEIQGLTMNLMQSIGIVAMVLILFLSLRAASIVLIAIPTTLLIVFGLGYLFDQTINRITLFALILSLGLLVDAAIVVVENMYVHLKRASSGVRNATREIIIAGSVNEIGTGLFLSTVTSVAVFLPVSYITGMMGPYMGPIAFFVPAALIVSMLVAIVIVPFVASYVLTVEEKQTKLSVFVDTYTERFIEKYKSLIQRIIFSRSLQKKVLLGTFGALLFVFIFPLFGFEHFQMLPRADRNQFYVYLDSAVDTPLENTKDVATEISTLITNDADVLSVQQFIGTPPIVDFNGMFKGAQYRGGAHQATFRVNLTSADTRDRSSTDIVTSIRHQLANEYPVYAPLVRYIEEPPGPPVRATLVAKLSSVDTEKTAHVVSALLPYMSGIQGVVDPYVSYDAQAGNIVYTFNREKAASLGVSEEDVASILTLLGGGIPVIEYMGDSVVESTPVVMTLSSKDKNEPTDINRLTVRTRDGLLVSVMSVLDVSYSVRPQTVYLERGEIVTYITGELEERPIIYVVLDIISGLIQGELSGYTVSDWNLFALTLTDTEGNDVTLTWDGEWKMTLENFRDLGIAMGVALLLVYATLVAQYRSFRKAGFIMVTVPLGLIGILVGFLFLDNIFGIYLTATALIGFIALIGIVVNNAIIFSEYVDQEIAEGTAFTKALIEAGGARFRPILLTSLTTILGSLTIVSDPVWSGLAWAIVFGLSVSTTLTLVVYPTLLAYFADTTSDAV